MQLEVLVMTWQEVFVGSPSGRGATGDALRSGEGGALEAPLLEAMEGFIL